MKLRIENLGAVKEATIDLGKKLIVFCGPNGTGKTWTAYAIGGLLDSDYIVPLVDDISIDYLINSGFLDLEVSPDVVFDSWTLISKGFKERLEDILPIVVANKKLLDSFVLSVAEKRDDFLKRYISSQISTSVEFLGYSFSIFKDYNSTKVRIEYFRSGNEVFAYEKGYSSIMSSSIIQRLAFAPISSLIVLPVERNSVYTFNTELGLQRKSFYENLKQNLSNSSAANKVFASPISRTTRYPKAVRDALDIADDIANISRTASPYYEFGKEVEQILLQGKVSIGEGGEVDFAPKRAKGKSFSFQLSSSAVKTLSSLIIYLKYQAKPNELLIIDEPELNLHPDNQILLARVFARMINKGIRLLISTHSDYIIRELNNLIMLSNKEEPRMQKVAQEFGYHEDEYILKEDVGAYLFHFKNEKAKHVTVEEIEVADNGFEVSTIEEAIKSLNAASEEIFYTLRHGYQHRDELS